MTSVLVAIVYIVILFTWGIFKWRARGLSSLLSCLLLVLAVPLAVFSGQALRRLIFSYDLARWNQAVVWVTSHARPNHGTPIQLPARYSDLAYGVHYKHDETCGLMIDFFWGGGFPVKHTARRYANNPAWVDNKQCRAGWSRARTISSNWYEISD